MNYRYVIPAVLIGDVDPVVEDQIEVANDRNYRIQ